VQRKGGREVFVPGRIVKVQRGNTFDVEVRATTAVALPMVSVYLVD